MDSNNVTLNKFGFLFKVLFLITIIFCEPIGTPVKAQNFEKIDSLKGLLQTNVSKARELEVRLLLARQFMQTDTVEMMIHVDQALQLSMELGDEFSRIDALDIVGVSSFTYGKYEICENQNKEALEASLQVNYEKGEARAYSRIAATYLFRGYVDTSETLFKKAIEIQKLLDDEEGLGYSFQGMGTYNVFKGKFDTAIEYYNESIELRKKLNDLNGMVSTYIGIANTYAYQSDYPPALHHYFKAMELIENGGSKRSLPNVINNIGNIYHSRQEYQKALEYYSRSLKLYQNLNDTRRIALSYKNMGFTSTAMNNHNKAIPYLEKSLELYRQINDRVGVASALTSLGEAYSNIDQNLKALSSFDESLTLRREIADTKALLITLTSRGLHLVKMGNYTKARADLNEALPIAENIGSLDELERVNRLKSELAQKLGNYKEAFDSYVKYKAYNDTIQSNINTRKITRMEADFEFQQERDSVAFAQEKIQIGYEEELKRKELINQALFGGGILALIILGLLFRSFLIKKEKNRELKLKNAEISELRKTEKKLAEETLALKERELTTVTMLSHEKNNILQRLEDQIGSLTGKVDDRVIPDLKEIKKTIKSNLSEESWSMFTYQFEKVHPDFFKRLKENYPDLTKHDLRLCAYIKVGMDNKEIASISNITTDGVKKSIYRLKKKMNLNVEDDIRNFMMNFE